jgi:hypothetical protein
VILFRFFPRLPHDGDLRLPTLCACLVCGGCIPVGVRVKLRHELGVRESRTPQSSAWRRAHFPATLPPSPGTLSRVRVPHGDAHVPAAGFLRRRHG